MNDDAIKNLEDSESRGFASLELALHDAAVLEADQALLG